jgi:hypothetical protein
MSEIKLYTQNLNNIYFLQLALLALIVMYTSAYKSFPKYFYNF